MKIKCLIVDDEPLARKIIREYLDEMPDVSIVAECQDALEANLLLQQEKIDLMFLDIAMPKISGMQFLRSMDHPPLVIFTTAYAEHAVEAFEVNAFDYLVKPITIERFLMSMQRVIAYFTYMSTDDKSKDPWISIKEGRRIYHVLVQDIIYLQAYGDYVRIFTKDQTLMPKEKLSILKDQLPVNFLQVHRSYIVNRDEIKFLEGNTIQVASYKIPVSDSYRSQLLEFLEGR